MLPASSLSKAAYGLRNLLLDNIDEFDNIENIMIGHPGDTIKELEDLDENALNLFFYDLNYDGFPTDVTSDNPFYVRLNCLITAVGYESSEPEGAGTRDVSKGENELRLIGEVMRILHENPVLTITDSNDEEIALLQVVPHTINLDNLNHIWSTQSETSYRLSVAYEMALAPIPNNQPVYSAPLVTSPGMLAWGDTHRSKDKQTQGLFTITPRVEYLETDTDVDNWIPHISLVDSSDPGDLTLHYVFSLSTNLDQSLDVLIAGKEDGEVRFEWNIWRRRTDNSIVTWKEEIADTEIPLQKQLSNEPGNTDPFYPSRIDPEVIDSRRIFQVMLPDDVRQSDTKSWQAVLYAVHDWEHEESEGSTELITTPVKSNMIILFGAA